MEDIKMETGKKLQEQKLEDAKREGRYKALLNARRTGAMNKDVVDISEATDKDVKDFWEEGTASEDENIDCSNCNFLSHGQCQCKGGCPYTSSTKSDIECVCEQCNPTVNPLCTEECQEVCPFTGKVSTGTGDIVNEPQHYKHGTYEVIDEMILTFGIEQTIVFCKLNAWKYRSRAPYKNKPEEDMAKSNRYLEMMAGLMEIKDGNKIQLLKGE